MEIPTAEEMRKRTEGEIRRQADEIEEFLVRRMREVSKDGISSIQARYDWSPITQLVRDDFKDKGYDVVPTIQTPGFRISWNVKK